MKVEVGAPATICYTNDRYPATVVRVENYKSGPHAGEAHFVHVQEDSYKVVSGSMFDGSAEYEYERDEEADVIMFTYSPHKQVFKRVSTRLHIGSRRRYYAPEI